MPYEKNLFAITEEKDKTSGEYIYGELGRENHFLNGKDQYRRFAPLARKALYHYVPDTYNPHTIEKATEWWVRVAIHNLMDIKVRNKIQYDWEYIDHHFRKIIGTLFEIDIPYDPARLEYVIPEAQVPPVIEGTN